MDINKVISIIRNLNEEGSVANVTGSGSLGFNPETESPPVKKKKKKPPIIARGLMPGARKRWSGGM